MCNFITSYDNYSIWQLSENGLMELAEFVVLENYKHHTAGRFNDDFHSEVASVYNEEMRYFSRSRVFVAKNDQGAIIGAIRLMNWNKKEILPIQSIFEIQNLCDISPEDGNTAVWHMGRLAVSTAIGRYGLILFKLLLLYAMYPICDEERGIVFAECDSKLLRTMLLMGIQVKTLGESIEYLGSETIPVYATRDGLVDFFNKNQGRIRTQFSAIAEYTQKCISFRSSNKLHFCVLQTKNAACNFAA